MENLLNHIDQVLLILFGATQKSCAEFTRLNNLESVIFVGRLF